VQRDKEKSMAQVEWVEPALLWNARSLSDIRSPQLLELRSDDFLPEFLAAMQTAPPKLLPHPAVQYLEAHQWPINSDLKLYQPLHGRFYLVTASLICRQAGLPDKAFSPKNGERISFVVRRKRVITETGKPDREIEQAWSDDAGWQPAPLDTQGNPIDLAPKEEQFPLNPVKVCTGQNGVLAACERSIYYGYIAVGNREKYLDKLKAKNLPTVKLDDPSVPAEQKVSAYFDAVYQTRNSAEDYRLNEFDTRVLTNWKMLLVEGSKIPLKSPDKIKESSLYLVIDFGDFLARALPRVWKALMDDDISVLSAKGIDPDQPAGKQLFTEIKGIAFIRFNNTDMSLRDALKAQEQAIGDNAARGEAELDPEATGYDLSRATESDVGAFGVITVHPVDMDYLRSFNYRTDIAPPPPDILSAWVYAALNENTVTSPTGQKKPIPMDFGLGAQKQAKAEEIVALIKHMVRPVIVAKNGKPVPQTYFLRLVYQYDPDCPPIISDRSTEFAFAGAFDPDAPARMVRIEAPSIRPADLRKFAKGVGIQLSPELNDVTNRVNTKMLEGGGLDSSPGLSFTFICTFSIQIVFLVALIVMFIFLILLNIVFWWLAFIRICLPVPEVSE
jgi:hypothetical protein